MKKIFLLFIAFSTAIFSLSANTELIDKIIAVVDGNTFTLSQLERIKSNIKSRKTISPQIYSKNSYSNKDIINIVVQAKIRRDKLKTIGYVIGDNQVESQIQATEKRLNLNRKALLDFLRSNNLTFNEYFEIIRSTIELNLFSSRVIAPMISITEQQIKNTFYNKNINNKTFAFKYTLVDFSISRNAINDKQFKNLKNILLKYQTSGVLPEAYKTIETSVLGDITEEGLTSDLRSVLKRTNEGSFSKAIIIDNLYHIFFVKKKDLVESEVYQQNKQKIKYELFDIAAKKFAKSWYQREANKHFIKYFPVK